MVMPPDTGEPAPADQDVGVLGFVVVALGGGFVLIGVNALTGDVARRSRPPVAGVGTGRPASAITRRAVAVAWMVLGVLFVVAGFAHLVP
ncbi:MAG TPA: hypothetical protein VEJ21_06440 [Acidimicrobiales bacterium]|nr:hypothetical protein [Acidimicrobiales bacterium]